MSRAQPRLRQSMLHESMLRQTINDLGHAVASCETHSVKDSIVPSVRKVLKRLS